MSQDRTAAMHGNDGTGRGDHEADTGSGPRQLWRRLGRIDENTTPHRAFWFGLMFLVVSGAAIALERFTDVSAGVLPLVGLAMVALALGDLVRQPTPTALARLTAAALVILVFIGWGTGVS
ncbi:MAG: hypothetical protein ACOCT8_02410 [Actinomycetota bacterium]